jgi:hypothetical protein
VTYNTAGAEAGNMGFERRSLCRDLVEWFAVHSTTRTSVFMRRTWLEMSLRRLRNTMAEIGAKFCRGLDRLFALGIERLAIETLCRKGDAEWLNSASERWIDSAALTTRFGIVFLRRRGCG